MKNVNQNKLYFKKQPKKMNFRDNKFKNNISMSFLSNKNIRNNNKIYMNNNFTHNNIRQQSNINSEIIKDNENISLGDFNIDYITFCKEYEEEKRKKEEQKKKEEEERLKRIRKKEEEEKLRKLLEEERRRQEIVRKRQEIERQRREEERLRRENEEMYNRIMLRQREMQERRLIERQQQNCHLKDYSILQIIVPDEVKYCWGPIEQKILKRLTVMNINDINKLNDDIKKCIICLEEFKSSDKVIYLPCCHIFHKDCIIKWVKKDAICPLCKLDLNKALQ